MDENHATVDWESEIAQLLEELSGIQDGLLDVLSHKRERMAANDLDGMQALAPREEELGAQLEACHRRRQQLLDRANAEGLPHDSLGNLVSAVRSRQDDRLGGRVKAAGARMRLLQHHSLTNWVLAQRSLLHYSQLLEILATRGQMRPTYGRGESVHSRGALVDREI